MTGATNNLVHAKPKEQVIMMTTPEQQLLAAQHDSTGKELVGFVVSIAIVITMFFIALKYI